MMVGQITGTIAARVAITAMGLLTVMAAGHNLGADGLGTIGLVVLGITLLMLPANLLGGGALVYLVPRVPLARLLPSCYAWAVVSCGLGYGLLHIVRLVPDGYELPVALLALIQAFYSIHLSVLIGQQRIRAHNGITVVQAAVLLVAFIGLSRRPDADAQAYVQASYLAFGSTFLLSLLALRRGTHPAPDAPGSAFGILLRQGAAVQGANAMQLLNYRLAYWLIEHFRGTAALGIYSVGNQLAEASWIVPKSLGLVLYSRISNTADPVHQRLLTLTILKVSMACASLVLAVLLIVPEAVFRWAFGAEVTGLFPVIALLAPGILAMAASQAFSHYFSGTGRNRHNLIGSGLGLLATAGLGTLLIPAHGLEGAAVTASAAYLANGCYQTVVFMRTSHSRFSDLWPGPMDAVRLKELLARLAPQG